MNHKKNERKIYMNCIEPIIENMQNWNLENDKGRCVVTNQGFQQRILGRWGCGRLKSEARD